MATKEEIIAGLELTISQGKRTTALFAEGEHDWKRATGWTPKEVYAHLAAVAAIIPQLGQGLAAAPEGTDIAQGMDINAMNAQAVGGMASMDFGQVMQAFEANYGKLIDYVKELPDDQMDQKRRFFSESIPVSDILANTVVLHGLHHVYEANSRFESPMTKCRSVEAPEVLTPSKPSPPTSSPPASARGSSSGASASPARRPPASATGSTGAGPSRPSATRTRGS